MFSGRFWLQTFMTVLFTMVVIYAIKKIAVRYDIPVVREIAEGV